MRANLAEVESRTYSSRPRPRTQKIRGLGQAQPFRGQILSRPITGMLKAKDQGHEHTKCSSKRKTKQRFSKNFFRRSQKKKRNLKQFFRAISKKKGLEKKFSIDLQNFNRSKNSAVFEPRTWQFSRT